MIRIKPIKLRAWFPPNNPVATAVARLCILREDLLLELYGIAGERFNRLDDNSEASRRLYFWRNLLRTLAEVRDGLNEINAEAEFREALTQETPEVQTAFESLKKELNKASQEFLVELRNTVGAHVDVTVLQDALNELDFTREGLVQLGDILGDIHYKFAGEFILAMLLRGISDAEQQQALEKLLERSAGLSRAVSAIDAVVACYARARDLRG
jgi:hypothetical protein